MKFKQIFFSTIISILLLLSLVGCSGSPEEQVQTLLENDLNSPVEITKLYYNEKEHGYFVKFRTNMYTDEAAIHANTGTIEYSSDFDYYTAKAEQLRNQTPINEDLLHEYNQKIINSTYATWEFATVVYENDGRPDDSNWTRIK